MTRAPGSSFRGGMDGNKRTAWVTARLFLADNGRRLEFDPIDAIRTMEAVAAGRTGETELGRLVPIAPGSRRGPSLRQLTRREI